MSSIELKFPNGGEELFLNDQCPITWNSSDVNSPITIELVDTESDEVYAISDSAPLFSEWPYQWTVGKLKNGGMAPVGKHYVIRIRSAAPAAQSDESNHSFSISEKKKLRITNPTGFSCWDIGSERSIQWQNPGNLSGNVRLSLVKADSIIPIHHPISPQLPASKLFYTWTAGKTLDNVQIASGSYKIRISSADGTVSDTCSPFSLGEPSLEVFTAKIIDNYWKRSYHWSRHWYCGAGFDSMGTGAPNVPAGLLRVGFENSYKHGFCEERKLDFYYRGFFRFDLQVPASQVESVKLTLEISSTEVWQGNSAANTSCCAASLNVLDSPYDGANTAFHHYCDIPAPSEGSITIDVTSIFKKWLEGAESNHGFMLRSANESQAKNNDRCITFFNLPSISVKRRFL